MVPPTSRRRCHAWVEGRSNISSLLKDVINMLQRTVGVDFCLFGWKLDLIDMFCPKCCQEGGETWFPRAHGGPVPWDDWTACDDRGVKMGSSSVAILFYSLYSSGVTMRCKKTVKSLFSHQFREVMLHNSYLRIQFCCILP